MPPCFPNYASPDQNNFVKSVIDTYGNTGPMHLSHKYPTWCCGGWEGKFFCKQHSAERQQKRSDARLTLILYQQHTHTPKEETVVRLIAAQTELARSTQVIELPSLRLGSFKPSPRALTALKLHLSYIKPIRRQLSWVC